MTAHDVSTCMRIAYRLCERHGWHGQWADVWRGLYYLRDPGWSWPGCSVTDDDGAPKVTLAQVVQLAVAALEETPADELGAELVRRLRALHSVDASRDDAEATPRTGAGAAAVSGRT